jgi:hypothetical protein
MPATATKWKPPGPETLRQRLAAVRRRLLFVRTARGTGWLIAALLLPVIVAGFLDWRFHLPPLVRALFLIGTLVTAGLVTLRYLLQPLSDRTDDLTLALRIEERFPGFNDSLASTVEFLEHSKSAAAGDSSSLRNEAIQRTLGRAQGLDFTRVVDRRGLRTAVLTALVALATGAVPCVFTPGPASTAVVRFAAPYGSYEWPHLTQIEIENLRQRIGRNEAYDIRAVLHGVIPDQASADFQLDNAPVKFTADVVKDGPNLGRLLIHVPPDRVQRSFRFRVVANDAATDEYLVTVLPPPQLVPLGPDEPSPHVRLFYPAYTDLPSPAALPPGSGNVEAVMGTVVSLRARADRPLRLATIEFMPEDKTSELGLLLAPFGASSSLEAATAILGGDAARAPVPATLAEDQRTFAVDITPRSAGMYAIHIEDESGLSATRLFELRLKADPAPTVQLDRPSPARDLLTVLPEATLSLVAAADDPMFAVRNVWLEYRIAKQGEIGKRMLYDPTTLAARIAPAVGSGVISAKLRPRPVRLEINQYLPIALLTHPDGSAPREGDIILLTICADDFDDVTCEKQPGRSHEVEVRVVAREDLDVAINQEQTRIQQDLLRIREKQREALAKVSAVEKETKKDVKLTPDQLDQVVQAEQAQLQVRELIGTDKEGLRARTRRVVETLRQNGLENSAERMRASDVTRELERLANEELEQTEAQLAGVRTRAELQEEKDTPEHRDQLEARAREAERQASAAEDAARNAANQAAKAAEDAAKTTDPQEKSRLQKQVEETRQQAEQQKNKARELSQEAQRQRRDLNERLSPARPQEALAEARRHEEEIERTLSDLLQQMEPFANSREIKAEAGRLLQEQQRLQQNVEELSDRKDFPRSAPAELNDRQRAELETLSDAQKKQEQRTAQLLEKMARVAEDRKDRDPETAKELQEARDRALNQNITGQMKDAAEQLKQNQLGKATETQKASVAALKQLLKNLEERREAELDRLAKKSRETEKELNQLFEDQERLKKKMKEAEGIADPKQREETLKKLQRQQAELQKAAQELVQRLSRERGTSRAGQALSKAGEQMEQATKQLARGEQADEAMDEALDRLDEARAETEQATDRAENELEREQRARIADTLKRLKDREEALTAESVRVQQRIRRAKDNHEPLRPAWSSLTANARNQKELGSEVADVAKKELTAVPVFARLVKRSAESMEQAGERLDGLKASDPRSEDLPDAEAARLQARSVRRLDQVIESLKDENAGKLSRSASSSGGGSGGSDGGADNSLPPTAQLKVLRKMQEEVNQRTKTFGEEHPGGKDLDDKAKVELQSIQIDQKDVAELLEQLRSGAQPEQAEGNKP